MKKANGVKSIWENRNSQQTEEKYRVTSLKNNVLYLKKNHRKYGWKAKQNELQNSFNLTIGLKFFIIKLGEIKDNHDH